MKTCCKCGEFKSAFDFRRDSQNRDGLRGYCRVCANAIRKAWRQTTESGRRCHYLSSRKWKLRHPSKRKAHDKVSKALRKGAIKRQPCERCGEIKTHAHHDDYTKPLQVRWLCWKHHVELHSSNPRPTLNEQSK